MSPELNRHFHFLSEAVRLARDGMNEGKGGPFGCVVVKDDIIIGRGSNSVLLTNDPTAHAEVVAIRDACANIKSFQLEGCIIYTSCEPCPMCMGAIYWARPSAVYFAASSEDAAAAGFDDSFIYEELEKPLDERTIAIQHFPLEDAQKIMMEWNDFPGKVLY